MAHEAVESRGAPRELFASGKCAASFRGSRGRTFWHRAGRFHAEDNNLQGIGNKQRNDHDLPRLAVAGRTTDEIVHGTRYWTEPTPTT